jgi:transketolase C-terminal domain/subunit
MILFFSLLVTVATVVIVPTLSAVTVEVVTVVAVIAEVVVTVVVVHMYTILPTNEENILFMIKNRSHVVSSTRLENQKRN